MEWLKKYRYPFLSGLAGVILACFILSYGFFKTLFVLICATLGVGIGYYIQQNNYLNSKGDSYVKSRKKSRRNKRWIDLRR